ncbi:hypothetical protein EBB07_30580 [Paenibacillaceae bacterium]|nr:hypothetical protein EBB07_30580 [Paenibacillaceae bacterium]
MNKKLVVTLALVLFYFFLCWMVDVTSSTIVMNASGRSYNIENHLFYNKYIFHSENNGGSNTEINLKLDRIFFLCISIVFLAFNLMKRSKQTK